MFSLFLIFFRLLTYLQAPYLFPAISSVLYFSGLGDGFTNLLVGFPIILPHVYHKIMNREQPLKGFINLDIFRFLWLLMGWFSGISLLIDSQSMAMQGFVYGAAIMVTLELLKFSPEDQMDIKHQWYILWGAWLFISSIWNPIAAPVSLLTHILNIMWEFRIVSAH